jgi:hypothetical protein
VLGLVAGAPITVELDAEVLVAVELDPEALGAFGDPGMSGAILETVVDDVDDDDDADDDAVWANAAVTLAIRSRSNVFFIRESP